MTTLKQKSWQFGVQKLLRGSSSLGPFSFGCADGRTQFQGHFRLIGCRRMKRWGIGFRTILSAASKCTHFICTTRNYFAVPVKNLWAERISCKMALAGVRILSCQPWRGTTIKVFGLFNKETCAWSCTSCKWDNAPAGIITFSIN
jgi:hypothetical protein